MPDTLLGALPSAPTPANRGACALLGNELGAYAAGSDVVVLDLRTMAIAAVLTGGHPNAPVTALAWCPDALGGRDPATGLPRPPRLASGDGAGRLVCWDVRARKAVSSLADAVLAATGSTRPLHAGGGGGHAPAESDGPESIRALAWAGGDGDAVVALASGGSLLLAWDAHGGGVAWARSFAPSLGLAALAADPTDRRRVAAYGPASGHVVVVALPAAAARRAAEPAVSSFRVGGGGDAAAGRPTGSPPSVGLTVAFTAAGDALVLALPRELTLFDLERGAAGPPSPLPRGLGAVAAVLATPRRAVGVADGADGSPTTAPPPASPLDLLFAWHVEGSVSVWARRPGCASYSLLSWARTAPAGGAGLAAPRSGAGVGAVVAVAGAERAAVCGGDGGGDDGLSSASSSSDDDDDDGEDAPSTPGQDALLILAVDDAGGVARWAVPLGSVAAGAAGAVCAARAPSGRAGTPAPPPPPPPPAPGALPIALEAVLHTPAGVTAVDACPAPAADGLAPGGGAAPPLPALLVAAGAADGRVWLASLTRGPAAPLALQPGVSVAAHSSPVRGVRWVGAGPALVSWTSSAWEQHSAHASAHGEPHHHHNHHHSPSSNEVCLIDARTRCVVRLAPPSGVSSAAGALAGGGTPPPTTDGSPTTTATTTTGAATTTDAFSSGLGLAPPPPAARAPILAVRPSPSGRHLILLLRGAPAEVWDLAPPPPSGSPAGAPAGPPACVRCVDLPFVDAAWVSPGGREGPDERGVPPLDGPPPSSPGRRRAGRRGGGAWRAAWARAGSPTRSLSDALAADGGGGAPSPPPSSAGSEERLAFALTDGRVGVLAVDGAALTDTAPRRPSWGRLGADAAPTAVAGWGRTVVLGDVDGGLHAWDVDTGAVTSSPGGGAGGMGCPVRALVAGPPPPVELVGAGGGGGGGAAAPPDPRRPPAPPLPRPPPPAARVAALFADGSYGVWEVGHAASPGGQGSAAVVATVLPRTPGLGGVGGPGGGGLPPASDVGWAPLPPPVGGGAVLLLAARGPGRAGGGGPLLALDVAGPAAPLARGGGPLARSAAAGAAAPGARAAAFRALLVGAGRREGGEGDDGHDPSLPPPAAPPPDPAAALAPPRPLGSSLLLPPAWRALLQLVLQGGLPPALLKTAAAGGGDAAALDAAAWAALPPGAAAAAGGRGARASSEPEVAYLSHAGSSSAASAAAAWRSTTSLDGLLADGGGGSAAAPPAPPPPQPAPAAATPLPALRLASALRLLASVRAAGCLLHADEWAGYEAAVRGNSAAARAAVAAAAAGCSDEASFWASTAPAALAAWAVDSGSVAGPPPPPRPGGRLPWTPGSAVAASRERAEWHAPPGPPPPGTTPPARPSGSSGPPAPLPPGAPPPPHDLAILERVALGDLATAVGLLLAAAAPDRSARHYREALCAVALAAADAARGVPPPGGAGGEPAGSATPAPPGQHPPAPPASPPTPPTPATPAAGLPAAPPLLAQACKVAAANAAASGDGLVGAPLLLAAGRPGEAAGCLADAGLWRLATTLSCTAAPPGSRDRAGALDRFATHTDRERGRPWDAAGVRLSAGGLGAAGRGLAAGGAPDAAGWVAVAAGEAGVGDVDGSEGGGGSGWEAERAAHAAGVVRAL